MRLAARRLMNRTLFAIILLVACASLVEAQSEVRLQPIGMASHFTSIGPNSYDAASSLRTSFGGRLFRGSHGLILDFEYTFDVVARFVSFDEDEAFRDAYGIGHVGYAFRRFIPAPRRAHRTLAFTAHASLSAGFAITEFLPDGPVFPAREPITSLDPVIGGRVGVDFDIHFRQYLIGWGANVEFLRHLRPQRDGGGLELERSVLVGHNAMPFFRFGFAIGGLVT